MPKEKKGRRKNGGEDKEDDKGKEKTSEEPVEQPITQDKTFLRYYHLYKKGELERDIAEAGGEVVEAGYEKDNWWAIAVRKR